MKQQSTQRRTWLIILGILIVPCLFPQGQVSLGGMSLKHHVVEDRMEFTLTAPTSGWVGIGFNDRDHIVGSDLYLFHVLNGQAKGQDMYVKAAGDPRLDSALGGADGILLISGKEEKGRTEIVFSLPLGATHPTDYPLEVGHSCWLILAYSTHDEFDHHSRMRRHMKFRL